ncbi:MAG: 4Fe-4S dicluster domain-containing protein [Spirochaetaceae bacterium]|nr:4Fe-4S dicluster domain-containing protein [Spirochaetaceae bacterium]
MKVFSFPHGGIELSDRSAPRADRSSLAFLPGLSVIPMIQHNGVHSYAVVSIGDHVEEGELIARGQGAGSANIHAPVPGTVVQFASWKLPEKITNDAIVIRLEGKFGLLGKDCRVYEWRHLSAFELRALMAEFGVIEMEGLGRPLSEIFSSADCACTPVTLVIRCVFDDPWLAADYCLCRERARAVACGALIAAKAAGAARICLAVSANGRAIAAALEEEFATLHVEVEQVLVSAKYPQRSATELSYSLRQYEKSQSAPLGALVFLGPATLAAAYDAVVLRKPVLDRYVAVGGSAIREPRVLRVRIGTRIADVFRECGGYTSPPRRIATGSPIIGRAVFSTDEPVIKTTYAVFAVAQETFTAAMGLRGSWQVLDLRSAGRTPGKTPPREKRRYRTARHCINCGECRDVCPARLDPEDIYKSINEKKHGLSVAHLVMRCHGCGCCEAVCPSNLPLCTTIINPAFKGD